MEKYELLCILGEGAFGIVYKAKNTLTEEIVAIKKFKKKFISMEECTTLREVKSLSKLNSNENLIKIIEMIFKDKELYLIFNYMTENLYDLSKKRASKKFSENSIKSIMFQVLNGIAYMHKYGFFHRDMKPENILVNGDDIKIADFGLAREIRSVPPYTDYVSTRWYRAPECLLKSTNYNSPVDIWALGCIMIELFNLKPIFPGTTEKEVLHKIATVLGNPSSNSPNIISLAKKIDFKFHGNISQANLTSIVPDASKDAIDFISQMLQWDPSNRATASNLLAHPFFTKTSVPKRVLTPEEENFSSVKGKTYGSSAIRNKETQIPSKEVDKDIEDLLENTQDFNKCIIFNLVINKIKEEKKKDEMDYEITNKKKNIIDDLDFEYGINSNSQQNDINFKASSITNNNYYRGLKEKDDKNTNIGGSPVKRGIKHEDPLENMKKDLLKDKSLFSNPLDSYGGSNKQGFSHLSKNPYYDSSSPREVFGIVSDTTGSTKNFNSNSSNPGNHNSSGSLGAHHSSGDYNQQQIGFINVNIEKENNASTSLNNNSRRKRDRPTFLEENKKDDKKEDLKDNIGTSFTRHRGDNISGLSNPKNSESKSLSDSKFFDLSK